MTLRCTLCIVGLVLQSLLYPLPGQAQHHNDAVASLKAAHIYTMTRFISWPSRSFTDSNEPFRICINGPNTVVRAFRALQGKPAGTRTVAVVAVEEQQQAQQCQILYLAGHNQEENRLLLTGVKDRPVLTVVLDRSLLEQGAAIHLYIRGDRLGMEIRQQTAQKKGLEISSRLLSLSRPEAGGQP